MTHKTTDEAMPAIALSFSEMVKKERLLLISKSKKEKERSTSVKDYKAAHNESKAKRTINRKTVTFDDVFTFKGKDYRVNPKKSGLYVEILESMINQFEIAATKWKRVFVLRFDLHQSIYRKDNKLMTAFRKRLFKKLKRVYGFKEIGFCWVREKERAKSQHYHWVLFLDGDLIKHSSKINAMIKQSWEMPCGSFHVPVTKRPFYFSDCEEIAQEAIYRASYLAKPRGKGYRDKQIKDYQSSRMKEVVAKETTT